MQKHTYSIFINGKAITEEKAKEKIQRGDAEVSLAFHGFGQYSGIFKTVSAQKTDILFISFDLFFHGKTKDNKFLSSYSPEQFIAEIEIVLKQFSVKKFHLLAFSIGSRPCLAIAQKFTGEVLSLQMIAPDGIYENPVFHIATRNYLGRALFKLLSSNETYLKLAIERGLSWTKGKMKLFKLALKVLNDHSITKIYNTWLTYAPFRFDSESILKTLQQYQTPISVVLSDKDHVISKKKVLKKLENCGNIFYITSYKHEKIISKLVKERFFEAEQPLLRR